MCAFFLCSRNVFSDIVSCHQKSVLFHVRRKGSEQCSLVHPLFSISFNLSKSTLTFRTVRQISTKPAECTSRQISTKPTQCILFCNYTIWSELPKSLNFVIKVAVERELLTCFNRISRVLNDKDKTKNKIIWDQGGRSWQPFVGSKNGRQTLVRRIFTIFATNALF